MLTALNYEMFFVILNESANRRSSEESRTPARFGRECAKSRIRERSFASLKMTIPAIS